MIHARYGEQRIMKDLAETMVFIGGPRQVGKTTLAKAIGRAHYKRFSYLNWDSGENRRTILSERFDPEARLLIFDELHKYLRWKQYIKGVYDTQKERFHMIVTGSARLDLYRRGGDSLMGRYHYYRLHPFSLAEILKSTSHPVPSRELLLKKHTTSNAQLEALFSFGGFPEPFFKRDMRTLRRWQNERTDRLIKEDIRDLEHLRDLSALQILVELMPGKVGALLSLNALREDLQVTHKTIALWMDVLERFYYHFRVYPYASTAVKSLRKQAKAYLWDWSSIEDHGARFENLVASHLLKLVHWLHDAHGYKTDIFYLRDIEGREVDFLVTVNRKPWFAVEVKQSDTAIHKPLVYFGERLRIPFLYQVVRQPNVDVLQGNVRIVSADTFLSALF